MADDKCPKCGCDDMVEGRGERWCPCCNTDFAISLLRRDLTAAREALAEKGVEIGELKRLITGGKNERKRFHRTLNIAMVENGKLRAERDRLRKVVEKPQVGRDYKCNCCEESAGRDGVCSDGCACSILPTWSKFREREKPAASQVAAGVKEQGQ